MNDAHQCTYTTRQLCLRDELVLKSIVRILHGQTQQNWVYDASPQSHVLILGTHVSASGPSLGLDAIAEPQHHGLTIRVGSDCVKQGHLMLPLRVGDVLVELNHASDVLTHLKNTLNPRAADAMANCHDATYSLLRWPAWNVLQQDSRYLRVATVLSTGATTIADLSSKTGVSVAVCDQMIRVLKLHDLIRTQAAEVNPAMGVSTAPSRALPLQSMVQKDTSTLWGRIRRRLGMDITGTRVSA